ncbi:hypothetical protein ACFQY5_26560 [Paeniroseomonas aquatica]|uniref:hypothetical protein n=1 Tax=Paeniroseomonas aquatica TaxID=373043 RepID=UPI00360F9F39
MSAKSAFTIEMTWSASKGTRMQAVHMCRPVAKAISRSWIWTLAPVKMSMLPAWS